MIDAIITIAGREIPIRRSFRALNDFDTKFKAERMSMLNLDVARLRTEHVIYMLLAFAREGYKAEGRKFDLTEDWLLDNLTQSDLTALTIQLMRVQEDAEGDEDTGGEKKSYKGGE